MKHGKVRVSTVAFLVVGIAMQSNETQTHSHYHTTRYKQRISYIDCLPSTLASSIVGAFTGSLARFLEREFKVEQSKDNLILLMIAWWIEHRVRYRIIQELEQDFTEADIPHKKNFMHFSAWLSSWVAYLQV